MSNFYCYYYFLSVTGDWKFWAEFLLRNYDHALCLIIRAGKRKLISKHKANGPKVTQRSQP